MIVETSIGKLEGLRNEHGVLSFKGVPYAAPPVDELRWQPPQPPKPWAGVRPAHEYGPVCHQWMDGFPDGRHPVGIIADSILLVPQTRSEDCLYLNIWTPEADNAGRPVMFWIHGGGLENGAGSQPNYDGSMLARQGNVVVVTINMRLGPFGYLRLDELTNGKIRSTGNEGRLDEIAALQWVRQNIDRFGGDPDNVTIFGQSAGAIEVACLLAASPSKGLFRRAILHSTAAHSAQSVEHAVHMSELFLRTAGVDPSDAKAIQALSPDDLVQASVRMLGAMAQLDPKLGKMHFNPVIDGVFLPALPYDAIRNGAADDVSIMVGTNLDDNRLGLGSEPPMQLDADAALAQVRNFLDDKAPHAMACYEKFLRDRDAPHAPTDVMLAIETDRVLRQPAILLSDVLESRGQAGHHFIVTYKSPAFEGRLGACHAVELPLLFGTHHHPNLAKFSGQDAEADKLSMQMQDAWSNFARTGDPSCESIGFWPRYGAERETMLIGTNWQVEQAPFEEERRFWADFPGNPRLGLM